MQLITSGQIKYVLKIVWHAAIIGLLIALFPAVTLAASLSSDAVSSTAQSTTVVHSAILWIAAGIFLIVNGLLIYSLIRFRHKSAAETSSKQNFRGNAILEAVWIVIPIAILIALLIFTFQTLRNGG